MDDPVIYKCEMRVGGVLQLLYVGSTVRRHRRWYYEHLNENYNGHGVFGRWIHDNELAEKIIFTVLEKVPLNEDREQMKKDLRRIEFSWKHKLPPQKFMRNDGLCEQCRETRLAIKREQDLAYRERNREKERARHKLYYEKNKNQILERRRQKRLARKKSQ